jgi:peptidoglycan hydrolase CwlO-like protein
MKLEILVQSKREQLLDIYTQAKTLKEKIQFLKKMMRFNQVQIKIAKARTAEEKQRYQESSLAMKTLVPTD